MMSKPHESVDTVTLREKIRMKKIDRQVYVDEMGGILRENREKRNALRIGNDCLRFMTQRQRNLSKFINARIFAERPSQERLPMVRCDLQTSILKNDGKLFRYGKRLLKQDHLKGKLAVQTKLRAEELGRAVADRRATARDYEERSEQYLHKQTEVEDNKSREVSSKEIRQRLERILDALNDDLMAFPKAIRDLEHEVRDRRKELVDFEELRDGAMRFLQIEQRQLDPLNEELSQVTTHFEKLIGVEKNELDERRKKSSLSKYLSEREAHAFNFTESSNITETKIKARNKALVSSRDTLLKIMDAMLVTNLRHVVDCIIDQKEVTCLLTREKDKKLEVNLELREKLDQRKRNFEFLKYNGAKQARSEAAHRDALKREERERQGFEELDKKLTTQDRLRSDVHVALHAVFEKLRPIKLPKEENLYSGELIPDVVHFTSKLHKMLSVIESKTVPVGHVKPLMLHVFRQRRVPPDSVRVELQHQGARENIQGFDAFEADQPGYISRDMLKARAEEAAAPKKKK
ncbi:uncharacterized protein LOC101849764 [Aplysia californica]|uniref:Uncharacterized protein LOC101849764 n=1 Tax=Aplysia californica TaxID=6500 RepID=A0ABM0ZYJ6_APLCA|nr:uncharacterized protein LOC101849764 [Aplysia californica]